MDLKSSMADTGYRRPRDTKSMHSRIVHDLGLRIVSGDLKPGDRLPTEASLCADYDVSRPVLREATRVMVAKGLARQKNFSSRISRSIARSRWRPTTTCSRTSATCCRWHFASRSS